MNQRIETYEDLLVTLRAQRLSLGMTVIDVDERAGLQDGYCSKLEAFSVDKDGRRKPHTRTVSWRLLFAWLGALQVGIELVNLADACLLAKHMPLDERRQSILDPHLANYEKRRRKIWAATFAAKAGSLGGKKAAASLGPRGRKARAKRAARARWRKAGRVGE